ncbi:MAG: response regulator [Ktedonobacterales bacterium]|nr:response regulator [Ktedonobacterales bacterium]
MTTPSEAPLARQRALLLDNDLFFIAKVAETLRHVGYETRTARGAEAFARLLGEVAPVVALVNTAARGIDWRAGIRAARAAGVPVIAFGAHVDLATQEEARMAGADRVIANSKLASDLPAIVARTVRRGTAPTAQGDAQTAEAEADVRRLTSDDSES